MLDRLAQKNGSGGGDGREDGHVNLVWSSHEIARRVLPFLSQHNMPVIPANYRLWYEYFSNSIPALNQTMDRMLNDGTSFTPELIDTLYHRFFSLEATSDQIRVVDQVGEKIQRLALEIVKHIVTSIAQSTEYSQSLKGHLQAIQQADDLEMVQNAIADILLETDRVLKNHQAFQDQMEQRSKQLSQLQSELRRTEELASTDELTGLPNRRAFNMRALEETRRSNRYGNPLSVILMDLDDFKSVNDNHGHIVGDRLLSLVAKAIKGLVRSSDFPARFGGEEFAVVCPETDMMCATTLADRLRRCIDETVFTCRSKEIRVTISAGVATIRKQESLPDILDRVDKGLYLAKKLGKNRVCSEADLGQKSA